MENYIKLIEGIKLSINNTIISSKDQLEEYRKQYLGANGILKQTFQELKQVPAEKRKECGSKLNELKIHLETFF